MDTFQSARIANHRRSISFDRPRNRSNSVLTSRSHTRGDITTDESVRKANISNLDLAGINSARGHAKISHRYFSNDFDDTFPDEDIPRISAIPAKPSNSMTVSEYDTLIERKRKVFSNTHARAQSADTRCAKETRRKNMLKNTAIFSSQRCEVAEFLTEPKYDAVTYPPIASVQFADLCVLDPKHNSRPSIASVFNPLPQYKPRVKASPGRRTSIKSGKSPNFYAQPEIGNKSPRRQSVTHSPRDTINSARSSVFSQQTEEYNDGDSDDEYFIRVESSSVTSNLLVELEEDSSMFESSRMDRGSVMYNGVPDLRNYFGEEARASFFMLYHRLSKKYDMAGPPRGEATVDEGDIDLFNDDTKAQLSPRHRFIHMLVEDAKHTPLPIIIRHNHGDTELNLAHRALGDDYIIYLSAVINELPNMTKVNLRDNRLTDRGMGKFIHVLTEQSHIDTVDLSENKLDSKSAEALSNYLRSEGCCLQTLRLSKADLDDDEIGLFMDALEINKSIQDIDLSHNKLGGPGEKSIHLKSDALSGGAAIAKALGANRTLLSMNLSWNKLGPASATTLGAAIFINNTLMTLNLAYNRIKDEGAEAIGAALASNICLTSLDLSYNGIGPMGAMVIAGGLRLSGLIKCLNISGNPIGERGGQALLETVNYHAVEREYILHDCAFDDFSHQRRSSTDVNMAYPTGKYTFDLAIPRNKCIVLQLIHMATIKRGCMMKNIQYRSTASISGKRRIQGRKYSVTLERPCNPAPLMGEPYGPWKKQEPRQRHPYTLLEADEWMVIQEKMQLLDTSTGKPWFVPNIGSLSFEFVYTPRVATPIECLNATGLRRIITILKSHPKEFTKILRMCRHLHMESFQLEEILVAVDNDAHPVDPIELFGNLLGCVRDTSNTYDLLQRHPHVMEHIKDVQLLMRQLFYVSVNAFTGHYTLDLSNNIDRVTGVRLMEISAAERSYIKRANPQWLSSGHGFTAQKQNRLGFRNEHFRRIKMEKGITEDFFSCGLEDKVNGSLEFDFVSSSRPIEGVSAITDYDLTDLLKQHGLLDAVHCPISHVRRRKRSMTTSKVPSVKLSLSQEQVPDETKILAVKAIRSHSQKDVVHLEKQHVSRLHGRHRHKSNDGDNQLSSSVLGHFVVDEKRRLVIPPPYTPDEITQAIASFGAQYTDELKPEDIATIQQDLSTDMAMYYADQSLDRFCVNVCIRILSDYTENIFEPIAFIRKTNDGKFESFGKDETSSNRGVNVIDILGLEGDNAHYEIGIVNNVNAANINPSHKRYIVNDDIIILGSEIYARLRCSDWNAERIHEYGREVVARLFSCIGVHKKCIRVVQHRTTDAKQVDFPPPKMQGIVNHVVLQQLDVYVEGIPIDDRMLLKTYAETGRTNSDDQFNFVNSVWRWRPRQASDRGSAKIDLNTFPYEFWGFKLMQLRTALSSKWITCDQAYQIAMEFPQFGYDAQPHRETAITSLFSRIVDLENFHSAVAALPPDSYGALYNRVGWLNAMNGFEFDFSFDLDLSVEDDRIITFMLAKFALVEPGDNFIDPRFRRSTTELFIPGWGLPTSWSNFDEKKSGDGVPRKGHLVVTYTSSAANGCQIVPRIRKQLQERFLLLSVPQGDGRDLFAFDEKPSEWDDMN